MINFNNSKTPILAVGGIVLCVLVVIIIVLLFAKPGLSRNAPAGALKAFNKLSDMMTPTLRCPEIKEGGTVRVYVSAGMFDMGDTLYAVGIDGIRPGLNYQSINLLDMICNLPAWQWKELEKLCVLWDVPQAGIVSEIEKIGWECFCPIRDGITMATIMASISEAQSYPEAVFQEYDASEAGVRPFSKSMFRKDELTKRLKATGFKGLITDADLITFAQNTMNVAVGTNVGANDLYNMYSTCNVCIMNYNGIQPDAGAVAEVGQLGARGVPCIILRGTILGDFGGVMNPMPLMATTAGNGFKIHLTNNPDSVFPPHVIGALPALKARVEKFIEAQKSGLTDKDPITNANYNHQMPLPPLQIFWADLGSKCFLLKHKSKSIGTREDGSTDFKKDYTKFWFDNMTGSAGPVGMIQVGKAMADNFDELRTKPIYKRVLEYWT